MKKIVLAPNPYRDRGLVLTNRAKELLELDGRETVVSPVFVDVPGDSNMVPLRRAAEEAELIISFGGDGTFLHSFFSYFPCNGHFIKGSENNTSFSL